VEALLCQFHPLSSRNREDQVDGEEPPEKFRSPPLTVALRWRPWRRGEGVAVPESNRCRVLHPGCNSAAYRERKNNIEVARQQAEAAAVNAGHRSRFSTKVGSRRSYLESMVPKNHQGYVPRLGDRNSRPGRSHPQQGHRARFLRCASGAHNLVLTAFTKNDNNLACCGLCQHQAMMELCTVPAALR